MHIDRPLNTVGGHVLC